MERAAYAGYCVVGNPLTRETDEAVVCQAFRWALLRPTAAIIPSDEIVYGN